MDFIEKAKIRIDHWYKHNKSHMVEYEDFVNQLEKEGRQSCAEQIRELINFTLKGNECLQKAIESLSMKG